MNYFKINQILFIVLAIGFATIFSQCKDDDVEPDPYFSVNTDGHSNFNSNALQTQLNSMPSQPLSAAEEAGLLFMREEEKLAHDVYTQLYGTWGIGIFDNIASSEQTHTEAVKLLLTKYSLTDPAGSNGIGVFSNTTLQTLHDDLLSDGNQSLIDGLKVGGIIEEVDILDLERELSSNVDNDDISLVYNSLLKGSRNHLRAFVKVLATNDVTYTPQFLTEAAYQEIITGEIETGN